MKTLILASCFLVLVAAGCGKADCTEFGKTWCERVKTCGGTPSAECETIMTNLCIQSTPGGCTDKVDASECVSAANSESCNEVLAAQSPSCKLHCK